MKKIVAAIILGIIVSVLALSGQTPSPVATAQSKKAPQTLSSIKKNPLADKTKENTNPIVDFEADVISKRDKADSTIYLVGNVSFHHNGAIIQCDSAARYSEQRMDCYGNVIINKDSAYIYGDRATYDGTTSTAEVFSPLVKMVRGDATLLTYNLKFNTKTSTATFHGGGYMTQKENVMESQDGEFNADKNVIKFLQQVAMRTEQYRVKTDSLSYNLDSETAEFLARPTVWDKDSSILEADGGFYYGRTETYEFVGNSYLLTKDQEMWADTMNYFTPMRQATMVSNVQVLDTTQRSIALSQWAFYDDSVGRAVLTRRASLRGYDEKQKDTTYMRADSILLLTFAPGKAPKRTDAAPEQSQVDYEDELIADSMTTIATADSMAVMEVDSLAKSDSLVRDNMLIDSLLPMAEDSLVQGNVLTDSLLPMAKDSLVRDNMLTDSLLPMAKDSLVQGNMLTDSLLPMAKDSLVRDSLLVDSVWRDSRGVPLDSLEFSLIDSLGNPIDSLHFTPIDSLGNVIDSLRPKRPNLPADSLGAKDKKPKKQGPPEKERIVQAYHNVRIWAKDYQAISDSTIAYSVDSLAVMYGRPVLWSTNSQITADRIDVYSHNEELDWADFVGSPFVIEKVQPKHPELADSTRFSQAVGNEMQAYFVNNDIDSAVMSGNVRNYYFMVSDEGYTQAFAVMDCARLLIRFRDREPSTVNWTGSPSGVAYPLHKIPLDNTQRLPGFVWYDTVRPKNAYEISPEILKSSRRTEVTQLVPPEFNIERQITKYRQDLLTNNTWRDRNDLTTLKPEYFQQQNMLL